MKRLRALLSRSEPAAAPPPAQDCPQPGRTVYVVGDLHGRADLLERILEEIDGDIGASKARDPHLVFVGDYVDFGPDSAAVLERLHELSLELPDNVTCVMGDHDRMLLDFLQDPITRGRRWLRSGAMPTLASFGVPVGDLPKLPGPETMIEIAALMKSNLTEARHAWLAERPLSWSAGNLWVVHAGADPQHPMEAQSPRTLLWGHPEFDTRPRPDGTWVAHGHTTSAQPSFAEGRIGLDTEAWKTGRLTACAIRPDGTHRFLQT